MSTATPLPWSDPSAVDSVETGFRSIFGHAPIPAARCNPQGLIVEMNPAFEQALDDELDDENDGENHRVRTSGLRLYDLVAPENRDPTESLLREVLDGTRRYVRMEGRNSAHATAITHWTAWRLPASPQQTTHVLLMAERQPELQSELKPKPTPAELAPADDDLLQTERWQAVGRLTGSVVHDFNNLLTGVMLYCDLLLSGLSPFDLRLRSYTDEIRSAIVQASALVRQLLVFARPKPSDVRPLCLNQIAQAIQDLLTRLIGANIALELRLDPGLGLVEIDPAQAHQIFLNLILNARDAMPAGGRITVETSNCKFQSVGGSVPTQPSAFPCVLLTVGDNGCGMDAKTRQRLFEPFFTTKSSGKGTGLGLTTVRGIVTTHRGLIHVESEPGRGTRVMILLPRASACAAPAFSHPDSSNPAFSHPANSLSNAPPTKFQEAKKESLL
jgi:signal transduction histidine kinase